MYFNTLLSIANRMSRQKFEKDIGVLKNTVNIINLNDILRKLKVHDGAHTLFKYLWNICQNYLYAGL